MNPLLRLSRVALAFLLVVLAGTVGYAVLGFGFLDSLYQTVTTITTVGFREVHPLNPAGQVFTMVLILVGAGTVFYLFGILLEALIEGHLRHHLERRRMDRRIDRMRGHVIVCGWGRVGRSTAQFLQSLGKTIVVIDKDPERLRDIEFPHILGDVTEDSVLDAAGIAHAHALIAALDSDADNVYVTLSSRALRADLVIIARARTESSKSKLLRAGANRAVNPQLIGGRRMAAFALQPNVAEFLDVVMHEDALEYRIEEIGIGAGSELIGRTLTDTALRRNTGALLLALRTSEGRFITNPTDETELHAGDILIVLGTPAQLDAVRAEATPQAD
ncbi:potassium channel family protein [Nocardia seriolae]|uniref:Potassium channel protein n=1 Tax=Nocardia seriolae TaxID=37332 RepID=A0ABC9YY94_9NOCA|nr:potassium channel protein [Nocardia seriolae]BEK94974.1 potassium channel protein [Nocardia seriolae]GAM48338.1 potassium channel protein [Nocardia seriolae]GAP30318.1 potassium channel protein [Nocardia seriolae]